VVSCALWNISESGNADDAMSIYSAMEITGSELCIVKCARQW
jgi:hypothetical protein